MASGKIQPPKKGILELLADGPVVGDGSMCMTLEKRGYATAGVWTPEAVVLYPDAVRQLLREYLRAGADVLQTPCYYASDGKLRATTRAGHRVFQAEELNAAACKMARDVANEGGALVCGGVSPVMAFWREKDMDKVREEFENQIRVMVDHGVDFLIGETFAFIEELEICVEVMKRYGKPIACTMRIGGPGDESGVSLEECTVRMARTGADIIGLNCQFDLNATLKAIKRMKAALEKEGLDPYLIVQPMGWMAPETENVTIGYLALPDFPLSLESRTVTRSEVHKFAREAYELGVRYIGGCCGMEPHHIRAIAQELETERGREAPASDMCPPHGERMGSSGITTNRMKSTKDFWYEMNVASGRPQASATNAVIVGGEHRA